MQQAPGWGRTDKTGTGNETDQENDPLAELARIVAGEPEPDELPAREFDEPSATASPADVIPAEAETIDGEQPVVDAPSIAEMSEELEAALFPSPENLGL